MLGRFVLFQTPTVKDHASEINVSQYTVKKISVFLQ